MKPIAYEIKRTLTSKFVIILIVVIVGLASLIAYESAKSEVPTNSASQDSIQMNVGYYVNGSTLHVVGLPVNNLGQPSVGIGGASVSYQYSGVTKNMTLNSPGYVNATFPISSFSQHTLNVSFSYKLFRGFTSSYAISDNINFTAGYSGLYVSEVSDPSNGTINGMNIFFVGPNGTSAPSMSIYFYNETVSGKSTGTIHNETQIFYTANVSGFHDTNVFPTFNSTTYKYTTVRASINSSVAFAIPFNSPVYPSYGKEFGVLYNFSSNYHPITQSNLQSLIFSGVTSIITFLLAILAVFEGYLTYGKDRTSGVLESVIKRPVSRGALIGSRFTANAVSIALAVVLSMLSANFFIHYYLHLYLTTSFDLYFIWSFVVEGLAFLALVYMFAHIVKSQGALLGSAIGLFVVFGLFWTTISTVVDVAFHITSGTSAYITNTIAFDYASPTGITSLFQILFEKSVGGIFGSGTPIHPSAYGVTPAFIVLAGLLWIAVPFGIALWLSTHRD
jgi:ABC-2 type transport system permease protein